MDAQTLKTLIDHELKKVVDPRALAAVRNLLIEPKSVMRGWDYGEPDQWFECWTVLDDTAGSETVISFCDQGFGPRMPWGLMWSRQNEAVPTSMGMDSGWFSTLAEAFYDSPPATRLPIWRVYEFADNHSTFAVSDEGDWDWAWAHCETLRGEHPTARYLVDSLPRGAGGEFLSPEQP
jgi:hypothetical protein